METPKDSFTETQSLKVIQEMVQVSQQRIKNDGILFIVWGWLMALHYGLLYYLLEGIMTYSFQKNLNMFISALPFVGIAFSLYYIYRRRKKVQTYIGISLRYVWVSLVICLSLTSLIIFNVIKEANFELQHPIFMMFLAFATIVTGGIIRHRLIIAGGAIFAFLAYVCSHFDLHTQLLFESAAWLLAFVIPGHILFANRKK